MTLAQEIEKFNIIAAKSTPSDVSHAFKTAIQNWVTARIDKDALTIGDKIPAFQLNDATGNTVSSNALLKNGPIVINFYRGGWCPYCNLELNALQNNLNEIKNNHGTLIAISAELPDSSLTTIEKNNIAFPVLTDRKLHVAREFGLVFQLPEIIEDLTKINGTEKYELPIPATYVVGTDHIIRYAFVDPNFMQRAEPLTIIDVLKNLTN